MEMCTGIADRVVYVSVARPAVVRRPAFHVGMRTATASTSTSSSARLSLEIESGVPRYLVGKSWTRQGNTSCTAWMSSAEQRIGVIVHLSRLVDRPEAPAKSSRMFLMQVKSLAVGARKMTRSSA